MKKLWPTCFLLFLLVSCNQEFSDLKQQRAAKARQNQGEITIGIVGPWKTLENVSGYWNGIQLALDEVNSTQAVLGRTFKIKKLDDSEGKGKEMAKKLCDDTDVVAVIGHYNSRISDIVSILYEYNGVLMISPTSRGSFLTGRGFQYVFRTTPTEADLGEQVADYMHKQKFISTLIYHEDDNHGRDVANAFGKKSDIYGNKVVKRTSFASTVTSRTFRKFLWEDKKNHSYYAIVFVGDIEQANIFLKETINLGITVPIALVVENKSPSGDPTPVKVNNTIIPIVFNHGEKDQKTVSFIDKYTKRFDAIPDVWAAQGYDAVHLLAHAMNKAKSSEPKLVADALRDNVEWKGVTGKYLYNDKGDTVKKTIYFRIVRDGKESTHILDAKSN